MCGISVIISQINESVSPRLIKDSTDCIVHRGPDGDGFYFDKNFAFGHRRLAIIDLSIDGVQPMQRHDLVITYNGEIFNYIELREELKNFGFDFETETDTEVILNAYKHWGYDCQNRFTGMWSFVIYDPRSKVLFCSRDRYCIKPFVYTKTDNFFLIGSEIKQFTIHPEFKATLNMNTTFDFLEEGLLNHNNQTFFDNVFSLNGGHQLIYDLANHTYEISNWYNPNFEGLKIDFESAKNDYDRLLKESIRLRLRSDVKLGVALSGGLDSSGIACLIKEINQNGDYMAITSCYEHIDFDERIFAEYVASKTEISLKKTYPNLNDLIFKNYLEKMIWHQEQPIGSASHFSEFSVFQEANKQGIKVMLCGQGPDEHSGGYGNFFTYYYLNLLKQGKIMKIFKNIRGRNEKFSATIKFFIGFLFINALKKNIYSNFINYKSFNKKPQKIKFGLFSKIDSVRKLSLDQIFVSSIPYQAHSEDRNSMCFSIESRAPYLDHLLLEYAVNLPDKYKINKSKNKWVLRETLKAHLPREIYDRKDKMGFVAPDEIWFKENYSLLRTKLVNACDILGEILNKEDIMNHLDNFIEGKENFSAIFMRVLTLAELCKLYKMTINFRNGND